LRNHPEHLVPIGDTGKSLVRSTLIYGANASGKSNLVKAMAFAQRLVTWKGSRMPSVETFRFQPNGPAKPSSFEFRFLINERVFIYGFELTHQRIVAEWLALKNGDDEVDIFSRDHEGRTVIGSAIKQLKSEDAVLHTILPVLVKLPLREHQLFLSRVNSLPEEVQGATLRAVLRWLTEELVIIQPAHRSSEMLEKLSTDDRFRRFSAAFLEDIDTGIADLKFEESERELTDGEFLRLSYGGYPDNLGAGELGDASDTLVQVKPDDASRDVVRKLLADHAAPGGTTSLPFCEESDGTQQLLHFLPILFAAHDENKVVVIDELDRSLHPLLCWEFVRFFSNSCPNARRQLIVTTHEAHLLNQELLRRDEYWFVEKDEHQQSQLAPLSEYNVRNDLHVQKGYLQGRFGAIPVFGNLEQLRNLLDCSEEAHAAQEAST
jgi:uncharacterized protein